VTALAPPIPIDRVLSPRPADEELAHWGQYALLEDFVTVLHRDGTPTFRRRWVVVLHGVQQIQGWERLEYRFDRRTWKFTIPRARVIFPGGGQRRASVADRPCDRSGHARSLTVAFANLAPGAVVELEDQQDNFTPFEHCVGVWGDFLLQTAHPCRHRRVTVAVARPFAARFEPHNGAPAPSERQAGEYRVWTWDLHDVAGVESDAWTPPPYEFAPWIDFTTLPGWKPVARYYLKHLRLQANPDLWGMEMALPVKGEGARDRTAAAYNYAARDVRYGRPQENFHDWAVRPLNAVATELRGDCKDKSALLVAMLRQLNVPARIALVRTSEVGRVALLPGARFNHALVLATVDGTELYLDPAGVAYTFGQLPSNDQGAQGLVLDRHEPKPILIPAARPAEHRLERVVRGRLAPDGSYVADARLTARGDWAARWRWGLIERNAAARERALRQYVGRSFPSGEIADFSVEYLDDLGGNLAISHRARIVRLARRVEHLLLLRVPWLEPLQDTGFFAGTSRPQPLLVPVHALSDRQEIELPPGFSGYGLPWQQAEVCDWGRYQCRVWIDGGALRCERDFELLGGIVPPERYTEVRRFTDACVAGDASDVVLVEGELCGKQGE
jgi:transglutaminase-like putative cysteine protease